MPPTHLLPVANATVQKLQDFLSSAKDKGILHAKSGKDGSLVLYVSKGKGTGFKQALFPKKFQTRKISARRAILAITGTNSAQNAALYASITSGYITKELDGANFVFDAAPLIVGELKSKLSEQIDLHEQALAEKYFKGIELDFDNGKVQTPFSAQNEKISPLAKGLQDAMEGIRGAAHELSGSDRDELRKNTADYIKKNLPNCPFRASYEYEEIIDFSLNFDRNINRLLKEVFEGPPQDEKIEKATIELADIFKELKFITNLLTNKEFIKICPEEKQEDILELGTQVSGLHELLNQPQGFYTSLGALTGLAINSPADFRIHLNKFKANLILANMPGGAIVDEK